MIKEIKKVYRLEESDKMFMDWYENYFCTSFCQDMSCDECPYRVEHNIIGELTCVPSLIYGRLTRIDRTGDFKCTKK